MTDPRIDGFNGFACKQKIYEVKMECERLLHKKTVLPMQVKKNGYKRKETNEQ